MALLANGMRPSVTLPGQSYPNCDFYWEITLLVVIATREILAVRRLELLT